MTTSLFTEHTNVQVPQLLPTMDDLHVELLEKRASLKPVSERQLGPHLNTQPIPQCKQIYDEFQQRLAANKHNKDHLGSTKD